MKITLNINFWIKARVYIFFETIDIKGFIPGCKNNNPGRANSSFNTTRSKGAFEKLIEVKKQGLIIILCWFFRAGAIEAAAEIGKYILGVDHIVNNDLYD